MVSITLSAYTIKGTVIDGDTQEPLIGAAILVDDGKHSVITDIDGKFSITTDLENAKVVVSYIGYNAKTLLWNKNTDNLRVEMGSSVQDLDEVVVIGYGVQKKSDLTGSVSSINAEDVASMPVTNVVQALQGRAPGVEIVQNSGAPGSTTSIRIRGMGTINNSDPLYVVDGMPMDNIDFISADDIESIEVLKDAASAAIYGSRAANGVVLVTTKDGSNSKKRFNINFSSYVGFQEAAKTPSILSKEDFVYFDDYVNNQYSKTMKDAAGALVLNPDYAALVDDGVNWWDEIYNPAAPMFKTSLSVYGGNDKLNYYLSGNWTNTDGIVKESGYDRKSFSAKMNVKLLDNLDFAPLILKALELPGFAEDAPGKEVTVGFGRKTLLDAAPAVLDAVKSGAVRHIFLVGGCDGAKPGRNYYTEFVEKTPQDTLILTLACGKFRFFDKDLGKIGPFPRLLDVGQCNDAYSAVKVALALADALKCGVNDLPLSLVLSWYEQKAVAILLTLLALGVKNIHLGPSLPAFVSPDILNLLVENWGIKPISTPDEDLKALLG
mgnify:CR=1 FL=1